MGAWPAVGGLALVGLVMVKEAVLWRRRQRQTEMLARRVEMLARRAQALAEERRCSE